MNKKVERATEDLKGVREYRGIPGDKEVYLGTPSDVRMCLQHLVDKWFEAGLRVEQGSVLTSNLIVITYKVSDHSDPGDYILIRFEQVIYKPEMTEALFRVYGGYQETMETVIRGSRYTFQAE